MPKEPDKDVPKPSPIKRDERVKIDATPEEALRVLLQPAPKKRIVKPRP